MLLFFVSVFFPEEEFIPVEQAGSGRLPRDLDLKVNDVDESSGDGAADAADAAADNKKYSGKSTATWRQKATNPFCGLRARLTNTNIASVIGPPG